MPEIRDMIEEIGYVNDKGVHVYGSAAYLHCSYLPISEISPKVIEIGKKFIEGVLK